MFAHLFLDNMERVPIYTFLKLGFYLVSKHVENDSYQVSKKEIV